MDLNKKRIAVICQYELLAERVGGMDYFFWEFDKKCKSEGFEVDWFFPNVSDHGHYNDLHILYDENSTLEQLFIEHISIHKNQYSHIFTHFLELCTPFFKKVKQLTSAKIIAVDHNPRPLGGYPLKKKILKRLKGFLFSRYIDLFVGVSNYTVQELIKDFGSQIEGKTNVIYNGISIDDIQIRQNRKKSRPKFLTASHLRYSKGIQDLIEAVFLLPMEIKDEIVIDIYGDGPYRENLEAQVRTLALEKSFNFMGSTSKLKSIYCNYDYMLQPTHMECFSLSILESLAANVPVIATNVGGNEEAITNNVNGYIVKSKKTDDIKAVLEDLWEGNLIIDIDTRKLIAERFTIDIMVANYIQLLA